MLGLGLVLLVVVFSVVAAILVVACVIVHRLAGWQWESVSQVPLPSVVVQASDKVVGVGAFVVVGAGRGLMELLVAPVASVRRN